MNLKCLGGWVALLSFGFGGCASTIPKYEPHERGSDATGYSDYRAPDGTRVVRFSAPRESKPTYALAFARFRAYEICHADKKLPDESWYASRGYLGDPVPVSKDTYLAADPTNEKERMDRVYDLHMYDIYFKCRDRMFLLGVNLEPVPSDEVKNVVPDRKPIVMVRGFLPFSPLQSILKKDDAIVTLGGARVVSHEDVKRAVDGAKNKDAIPARVVTNGKLRNVVLRAGEVTETMREFWTNYASSLCAQKELRERAVCQGR